VIVNWSLADQPVLALKVIGERLAAPGCSQGFYCSAAKTISQSAARDQNGKCEEGH
jgi:hypothetical protein